MVDRVFMEATLQRSCLQYCKYVYTGVCVLVWLVHNGNPDIQAGAPRTRFGYTSAIVLSTRYTCICVIRKGKIQVHIDQ